MDGCYQVIKFYYSATLTTIPALSTGTYLIQSTYLQQSHT